MIEPSAGVAPSASAVGDGQAIGDVDSRQQPKHGPASICTAARVSAASGHSRAC